MEKKDWLCRRKEKANTEKLRELAKECEIDFFMAAILDARGYYDKESIDKYLHPKASDLSDPYLLPDMMSAVDRVCDALDNNEKVAIYADYDADGTTAASILLRYFQKLGLKAGFYVPNRLYEGYGMNIPALEKIAKQGITLVISVDNGISSVKEAAWLKEHGIDLIVTDHHEPHETLPDAAAIVDAKRTDIEVDCFREFCGAGVAFKFVQAMDQVFGIEENYDEYLQMAACATVADLVPLVDENRTIVSLGLKGINEGAVNPGLAALVATTELPQITSGDIAYRIGPMLNAPGRLGRAKESIMLLSGQLNDEDREEQAKLLFVENEERKAIERDIEKKAEEMVRKNQLYKNRIIVLSKDSWHSGVIGIAASKIQEIWYRPVIIASGYDDIMRGSCRSVEGFNIFEALCSCSDLFESFGGHAQAAGFSIKRENLPELDRRLNEYAKNVDIDPLLVEKCFYDARVQPSELTWNLERKLKMFEPCGLGNPGPSLLISPIIPEEATLMGQDAKHLRFSFNGIKYVGFNMDEYLTKTDSTVAVLGKLKEHTYNGQSSLQVQVRDIKASPFTSLLEAVELIDTAVKNDMVDQDLRMNRIMFRTAEEYSGIQVSREKVLKVYNVLRKYPQLLLKSMRTLKGMNTLEKAASMIILRDEGLMNWKIDEGFVLSSPVAQTEKKDLTKNAVYQMFAENAS